MKKFLSLILFVLLCSINLFNCDLARSNHFYKNYTEGMKLQSYVGEVMILVESGLLNPFYKTVYPGGIRWELIYAGKMGDNIKIYYREFVASDTDWLVKDGFTQEYAYDLKESNIIRYKELLLEIISANNQEIEFKVLSDKPEPIILDSNEVKTGRILKR